MSPPFGLGLGLGLDGVSSAGPSASYVPGTISSMVLALEAGRGGFATDQSGKGNNFTLVNAPTVTAGVGPGGSSIISLNGSNQCITRASSIGSLVGATAIIIGRIHTSPGNSAPALAWASSGNWDFSDASGAIIWDGGSTGAQGIDSWWGGTHAVGDQSLPLGAYHCVRIDVDTSGNLTCHADGAAVSVTAGATGKGTVNPTFFSFGSRVTANAPVASYCPCDLAAAYVTNAPLAGANKTALAADLATRFGVTL